MQVQAQSNVGNQQQRNEKLILFLTALKIHSQFLPLPPKADVITEMMTTALMCFSWICRWDIWRFWVMCDGAKPSGDELQSSVKCISFCGVAMIAPKSLLSQMPDAWFMEKKPLLRSLLKDLVTSQISCDFARQIKAWFGRVTGETQADMAVKETRLSEAPVACFSSKNKYDSLCQQQKTFGLINDFWKRSIAGALMELLRCKCYSHFANCWPLYNKRGLCQSS